LTDRLRAAAGGEVYLVGIPHPVVGQVLGCAVTRPDDVERLRAWSQRNLGPAERPRAWAVVEQPPLTAAGKIDTSALAALIRGHHATSKEQHS